MSEIYSISAYVLLVFEFILWQQTTSFLSVRFYSVNLNKKKKFSLNTKNLYHKNYNHSKYLSYMVIVISALKLHRICTSGLTSSQHRNVSLLWGDASWAGEDLFTYLGLSKHPQDSEVHNFKYILGIALHIWRQELGAQTEPERGPGMRPKAETRSRPSFRFTKTTLKSSLLVQKVYLQKLRHGIPDLKGCLYFISAGVFHQFFLTCWTSVSSALRLAPGAALQWTRRVAAQMAPIQHRTVSDCIMC